MAAVNETKTIAACTGGAPAGVSRHAQLRRPPHVSCSATSGTLRRGACRAAASAAAPRRTSGGTAVLAVALGLQHAKTGRPPQRRLHGGAQARLGRHEELALPVGLDRARPHRAQLLRRQEQHERRRERRHGRRQLVVRALAQLAPGGARAGGQSAPARNCLQARPPTAPSAPRSQQPWTEHAPCNVPRAEHTFRQPGSCTSAPEAQHCR